MLLEENNTIDFLLNELIKNKGQANFYILHGKGYSPTEIINSQTLLSNDDFIKKVPGAIGVTYAITTLGRKLFYNRLAVRVLKWLSKEESFIKVSSILKEFDVYDPDGDLAETIEGRLIKEGKVFATENDGIMINDVGHAYLREIKYNFHDDEVKQNLHGPTKESFTEVDKQAIISHIEEALRRFDKLDAGQQVIFEEIESLKEHLNNLNKKDWTQLLKGKLIDLGAKKVIDFAVMNVMFDTITESLRAGQFVLPQ